VTSTGDLSDDQAAEVIRFLTAALTADFVRQLDSISQDGFGAGPGRKYWRYQPLTLSDAIKKIGRRHRLSPTDIAAALGKSYRCLQRWMRGDVDHLRRKDLLVIKAMLEHGELVSICLGEL
jgi:hypothetical protein